MNKYFSINEVVKRTGLSASNIRYYESEGLIQKIIRNASGIRQYSEQEIQWIKFLGKLKDMEMPIIMMKRYAYLREKGDSTIQERVNILEQHKKCVLQKIEKLYENITLLDNKIEIYKQMEEKK